MSAIPPAILQDWDAVAASLGVTPQYDANGEIIPIGKKEGAHVYVVWQGRAVGLFYNWGLAHAMISGFNGAAHKRYPTLAKARVGWQEGPTRGAGQWHIPRPRAAIPTPGLRERLAREDAERSATAGNATTEQHRDAAAVNATAGFELPTDSGDSGAANLFPLEPAEPARVHIPPGALIQQDGHSDNDSEEFHDAPAMSRTPSPTPSSPLSSISGLAYSLPSLTSGTVSPWTVSTPALSIPELASVGSPPQSLRRAVAKESRAITVQAGGSRRGQFVPSEVSVASDGRDREFYVVVRGDRPGVYADRNTAIVMLGANPGMKVVPFRSLSKATLYFTKQYMAGKVGVPQLIVDLQ